MKKILIFILILISITLIYLQLLHQRKKSVTSTSQEISPIPTSFPFQEMTIPYLRSREYKGNLSNLEKISENQSYTSYLTSYQSDGLKINGLLTIPAGDMPVGGWPAIVFIHGYIPPKQYATREKYVDYVDYLARNGFVVFKIDLRGNGESEGEPGGAYYSSDYIIDTLNAYAALQSNKDINPKKIGLWGHSMAGNVVMRSLAAKPTIPAVVIWGGSVYSYSDRLKYGINDASYQPLQSPSNAQNKRREIFNKYGDFDANSDFWKQIAPTNYLQDIKGAIQLDHAVDDSTVNIGYSRDLNALLDKTTIPHELHEYPSGGHNISGSSFNTAMQNTVTFFRKYLQ